MEFFIMMMIGSVSLGLVSIGIRLGRIADALEKLSEKKGECRGDY